MGTAGKVPVAVPVQATIIPLSGDGSAFVSATNEVLGHPDLGSDTESTFTVPVASVFAVDDVCSASSVRTEFPTSGLVSRVISRQLGALRVRSRRLKSTNKPGRRAT